MPSTMRKTSPVTKWRYECTSGALFSNASSSASQSTGTSRAGVPGATWDGIVGSRPSAQSEESASGSSSRVTRRNGGVIGTDVHGLEEERVEEGWCASEGTSRTTRRRAADCGRFISPYLPVCRDHQAALPD